MELYSNSDIEEKRYIIGLTFPEKWVFLENNCRTGNVNLAALLIYHINKGVGTKKVGFRAKIRTKSDSVPSAGVKPDKYLIV